MVGYVVNIEEKTTTNNNFREVLFTAPYSQLVVMSLKPGEDIGSETHDNVDQFFRIEAGEGKAVLAGEEHPLSNGFVVVVPAGTEHNITNTSVDQPLQLYTIYSPANHRDGVVHATKQNAMSDTTDVVQPVSNPS